MNKIIRYRKRPYVPIAAQVEQATVEETSTHSAIDLKALHIDVHLKTKELMLNNAVRANAFLSTISSVEIFKTWDERLQALGMAVTVIDDQTEDGKAKESAAIICEKFPRRQSVNIKSDPVLSMRGLEFIAQFLDREKKIDATNYALGLRVGLDAKNNILDDKYINGFRACWNSRLSFSGR